jgi:hypothetical protein
LAIPDHDRQLQRVGPKRRSVVPAALGARLEEAGEFLAACQDRREASPVRLPKEGSCLSGQYVGAARPVNQKRDPTASAAGKMNIASSSDE